jgi:hypothetical protein
MKVVKIILLVLLAAFVVIQFIRPTKNVSDGNTSNDISTKFGIPEAVLTELHNSCYDCHSNNTRYPWYVEVQPAGWLLDADIRDGKKHLNFSEFGAYRLRRQYIKLEQIADQVNEAEMPLPIYTIIHTDAKLSPERRARLAAWANAMRDSMKTMYPLDSLERK